MRTVQLGEFSTKGSLRVIELAGKRLVIDSGIGFGRNGEVETKDIPEMDSLDGQTVDIIIITHSHDDHKGSLPRLMRKHPEALVFITDVAYEISKITLPDSLKIMMQDKEEGKVNKLLFDANDLYRFFESNMVYVVETRNSAEPYPFWLKDQPWQGWQFGFAPAGHTQGAWQIAIDPPTDRPVFLTGDIASFDQEVVPGALPVTDPFFGDFFRLPGLVMITEATNGARPMTKPRHQIKTEIYEYLKKEVEPRGGVAFFPTFAQTKSTNDMIMLVEMGFTPWVDGLARQIIRAEFPQVEEWLKEGKVFFFDEEDKVCAREQRERAAKGDYGFMPIIAPSATLEKGFAVGHAERILPGYENALIFTGHMFEGSTAKQILEIERGRTIKLNKYVGRGKTESVPVDVRCEVKHFDLSSHDYQDGLVERVRLANPSLLIIEHCDESGYKGLRTALGRVAPHIPVAGYNQEVDI